MRVLVLWADDVSPNLGVRTLARGSRDLLLRIWPDAEIAYADFTSRPAQIPWGLPRSLLRERVTGRRGMQRWLGAFDVVWDTRSGDSFADIYGQRRHTVMSLVHEFAVQAGARVVIAPQTIGPFHSRRGRALAGRSLRRSALVFARDPRGAAEAEKLGRGVDAAASDLVFAIEQPAPGRPRDVMVNVSGLLWHDNRHVDSAAYRETMRAIVRALLRDGRAVTLFPHVLDSHDHDHDNDAPAVAALHAELSSGRSAEPDAPNTANTANTANTLDIFTPHDLDDVRSALASANLVIGARMHACLNAISTGVPAIALAYSRKFEPLLDAIDWPHSVSLSGADPAAAVLQAASRSDLAERALASQRRGRSRLDAIEPLLRGM